MTLSYFTGTTRRFVSCFVNALLPTTEIFEMVLLSEFSILFLFILERVGLKKLKRWRRGDQKCQKCLDRVVKIEMSKLFREEI